MRSTAIELTTGHQYLTKSSQTVTVLHVDIASMSVRYRAETEAVGRGKGRAALPGDIRTVGLAGFRKTIVKAL